MKKWLLLLFLLLLYPSHHLPPRLKQYNLVQYNTVQYNTVQYNTVQYNTVSLSLSLLSKKNRKSSEKTANAQKTYFYHFDVFFSYQPTVYLFLSVLNQ